MKKPDRWDLERITTSILIVVGIIVFLCVRPIIIGFLVILLGLFSPIFYKKEKRSTLENPVIDKENPARQDNKDFE